MLDDLRLAGLKALPHLVMDVARVGRGVRAPGDKEVRQAGSVERLDPRSALSREVEVDEAPVHLGDAVAQTSRDSQLVALGRERDGWKVTIRDLVAEELAERLERRDDDRAGPREADPGRDVRALELDLGLRAHARGPFGAEALRGSPHERQWPGPWVPLRFRKLGEVFELQGLAVAFELDRESRLRDHPGPELVDREPDDRSAEGVGGVAHKARAGGHLGARDPDRVPQGMPGAKLIAQMRTPSGTSSSIR